MSNNDDFESSDHENVEGVENGTGITKKQTVMLKDVTLLKEQLIHVVSASMIKEPNFDSVMKILQPTAKKAAATDDEKKPATSDTDDDHSESRSANTADPAPAAPADPIALMVSLVERIAEFDGEFPLKLALYIRNDLGLRGSANFITAVSSYQVKSQPFLRPYLPKIVNLPTDWMQIASFARDLPMRSTRGLPTALRHALVATFEKFDEFALAKYNTESAQKKRRQKSRNDHPLADDDDDDAKALAAMPYTLKQLIRMLHISKPVKIVMSLLGKRYPSTEDEFRASGLAGPGGENRFSPEQRGKRMRLPIPRTWETDLASQGNHAHVWDALVGERKLPFMATLRNLRNIILAGCMRQTHLAILARLQSEEQVASSRQFPYRFFSAFDVLKIDPLHAYDAPAVKREGAKLKIKPKPPTALEPEPLGQLLAEYRTALDRSVQLATKVNIRPIHGRTVVIVSITTTLMKLIRAQGAKGIGSVRTYLDVSILLALMFVYACESCDLILFCRDQFVRIVAADFRAKGLLVSMEAVKATAHNLQYGQDDSFSRSTDCRGRGRGRGSGSDDGSSDGGRGRGRGRGRGSDDGSSDGGRGRGRGRGRGSDDASSDGGRGRGRGRGRGMDDGSSDGGRGRHRSITPSDSDEGRSEANQFPFSVLDELIDHEQRIEALVVIDSTHENYSCMDSRGDLHYHLQKLRRTSNKDLLFVAVDVTGNPAASVADAAAHPNDVRLTGFSDSILRFVAERGGGGPRKYIENIHRVYNVDTSLVVTERNGAPPATGKNDMDAPSDESDDDSTADSCDSENSEDAHNNNIISPKHHGVDGSETETQTEESADGASAAGGGRGRPERGVLTTYRDFRFFISSTFLDMQAERQALVLDVFPALRKRALRMGLKANIVEIDYRWGITSEMAASSLAVSTCLNEVSRCSPFFIGLVGERYGYCPSQPVKWVCENGVKRTDFSWLTTAPSGPMSITEMEIRHAAHKAKTTKDFRGLCFFTRDSSNLDKVVPSNLLPQFQSESSSAAASVGKLRTFLRTLKEEEVSSAAASGQHITLAKYTLGPKKDASSSSTGGSNALFDLGDFSKKATHYLWRVITRAYGCGTGDDDDHRHADEQNDCDGAPDTLHEQHVEVARKQLVTFVATPFLKRSGLKFFEGSPLPVPGSSTESHEAGNDGVAASSSASSKNLLLLAGHESSGKTAAAAYLGDLAASMSGTVSVTHFFTPQDPQAGNAILHIAQQLVTRLNLQEDFEVNADSAVDTVAGLLPAIYEQASKLARVVIVVDGLDNAIEPRDIALQTLATLIPGKVPANIRFIVSVNAMSSVAAALRSREPPATVLTLPELTRTERAEFIRNHLSVLGKKLQDNFRRGPNQLKQLIRKTDAGKPAYLVHALTSLRLFSTFETITKDIQRLAATLPQLQQDTIKRFELLFGPSACSTVLVALLLTAPVGGIFESDLYVLASSHVAAARGIVNLLVGSVLGYAHDSGSLVLKSESLANAIRKKYLSKSSDETRAHFNLLTSVLRKVSAPPTTQSPSSSPSALPISCELPADLLDAALDTVAPRGLVCLLHHSLSCQHYEVISAIIQSVPHLIHLVEAGLLPYLLNSLARLATENKLLHRKLAPFVDFLIAHRQIFVRRPAMIGQCALNMPPKNPVRLSAMKVEREISRRPWVEWSNRELHGEKECTQTTCLTTKPILCVAYDPAGTHMALGGADWILRVVNIYDGTVPLKLKHPNTVTACAFLPKANGNIVTGCEDGVMRVWNIIDGALIQEGQGHTRRINSFAVHPSRPVLLSAGDDAALCQWNMQIRSYKLRPHKVVREHNSPVSCCAIHQGGIVFCSGGWDGKVFIRLSEEKNASVTTPNQDAVRDVAFVPSMIVTIGVATYSGQVFLYDVAGSVLSAVFDSHRSMPITSIDFSSDAKYMLTSDVTGKVQLWRCSVTGEVLGTLAGHHNAATKAKFHPTQSTCAVSSSIDASIRHWTFSLDGHCGAVHTSRVTAAAASPDGMITATGCADGIVLVMNQKDEQKFSIRHSNTAVRALLITDDTIFTAGIDGRVKAWRCTSGLAGNDGALKYNVNVAFRAPVVGLAQLGQNIIAASSRREVASWAVGDGGANVKLSTLDDGETADVEATAVVFAPGEGHVGVLLSNGVLFAVDEQCYSWIANESTFELSSSSSCSSSSSSSSHPADNYVTPLWAGALSSASDGTVACGSDDGLLVVIHEDGTAIRKQLIHDIFRGANPTAIQALCCLPNGRVFAGCDDGTVRLYETSEQHGVSLRSIFHASAPVTALSATAMVDSATPQGPAGAVVVVAGDALGNVYSLKIHMPAADGPQSFDLEPTGGTSDFDVRHDLPADALAGDGDDGTQSVFTDDSADGRSFSSGCTVVSDIVLGDDRFFGITETMPIGLKGEQRRQWLLQKRLLLKEAMLAQRTNATARLAIRLYSQNTMKSYSAYQAAMSAAGH